MADRNIRKKNTMDIQSNQKTKNEMAVLCFHLSIFMLNVNGLNSLIKSQQRGWVN